RADQSVRHARGNQESRRAARRAHGLPPRRTARRASRAGDGDPRAGRHLSESAFRSALHPRAPREQARRRWRDDVVSGVRTIALPTYEVTVTPGALDHVAQIASATGAHRHAVITDDNVGPL